MTLPVTAGDAAAPVDVSFDGAEAQAASPRSAIEVAVARLPRARRDVSMGMGVKYCVRAVPPSHPSPPAAADTRHPHNAGETAPRRTMAARLRSCTPRGAPRQRALP